MFPDNFIWGVAASAFQIEGSKGRGRSVWDDFCDQPGRILDGSDGRIACDHIERWRQDVDLIGELGVNAYRFSIAWPRVFPEPGGLVNAKGLAFYDRLTDALLEKGVDPWVCVHHWDVPDYLEASGGWRARDIAPRFAEFCHTVMAKLGDRIAYASPFNEPNVVPWVAYDAGHHAPGRQSREATIAAMHHLNLAQGMAFEAMREASPKTKLGGIYSLSPVHPKREDEAHVRATEAGDAMWRRIMLDPLILGRYPDFIADEIAPHVREGDMSLIHQQQDYFGLNHYARLYIEPAPERHFGAKEARPPNDVPVTGWGWQIDATALVETLEDFRARYPDFDTPIIITENGAAFPDVVRPDGTVDDRDRIAFFSQYLQATGQAIKAGFDIRGYFFWSILDNFEWNAGYTKRFGLVHVDYDSLDRTPKASYHFIQNFLNDQREGGMQTSKILKAHGNYMFPMLDESADLYVE